MGIFFEILLVLSPFCGIVLMVFVVYHWDNRLIPRIKFKDFKKFYELNPKRWHCETDYVKCQINEEYDCEVFAFSFIDKCKYGLWRRKCDKRNTNQKHMKSTQRMLDAVQADVATAKAKEVDQLKTLIEDLKQFNAVAELPSLVELLKKYGIDKGE